MTHIHRLLFASLATVIITLCSASLGSAQTPPTILVLGVGQLAVDVPSADLATAQAQTYRVYVGTAPAVKVPATCSGTASPFACAMPLSALPLTSSAQSVAVTAAIVAADGEVESAKAVAPFVLAKVPAPVAPVAASARVKPGP